MNNIPNYNFKDSEYNWQKKWDENNLFHSTEDKSKEKYYVLEMFPYPSGNIHMGHMRNYTIGDVIARYKRSSGFNVLHPMGWDSFGLPAENAAIERNVHPAKWTFSNISHMREQLKTIGFSYDWGRELTTCSADYYKHEQKMFLDFLDNGLAYQKESTVNWDPVDNTVLANEQVVDGRGWRSGALVERKNLRQWFLKISDFSNELLESLKTLENWPDKVKIMQDRWIGKSQGAHIWFKIKGRQDKLEVFTTRPDTLFGASFCAIASGHPIAIELAKNNPQIEEFNAECNKLGMAEKTIETAEKKGLDTGLKIIHPFDESIELPLYIANFVLMEYGTGAIFACPAHDQRDLDFARKYNLPVTAVVSPNGDESFCVENEAYTGDGTIINSEFLNGLNVNDAKKEACERLEKSNQGKATINYRLRDWGISRQRYWGCPIPIIYCDDCGAVPVPAEQLPVTLPDDVEFDKPGNPLDRHPSWKHVDCPKCGKAATRETDTFDTFFESSWYFARFCAPNDENGLNKEACDYWLPVDQYIGGVEHAVLHLLYARFFTLSLNKCGYISAKEPFKGLLTQGMVCHETYKDSNNKWLFPEEVRKENGQYIHVKTGDKVTIGRSEKMSKSKKNVVDPISIIDAYGADTARLFMLSDSPPDRDLEWSDAGVDGAWRYVNRLWKLAISCKNRCEDKNLSISDKIDGKLFETRKLIHKTIVAVTEDLDNFRLNKAVARLRELTNALEAIKQDDESSLYVLKEGVEAVISLFAPMIPHITEEIWHQLGNDSFLIDNGWPKADPALTADDTVTIAVQINGKLKATIDIQKDSSQEDAKKLALDHSTMQNALQGKEIKKIIVVPNRIVNVVAA
ncbi:leucine--tRNA ligase [Rickettsiales bacterium]|nr:leucine--tRNA ligase [Rickettsiales bacterium]